MPPNLLINEIISYLNRPQNDACLFVLFYFVSGMCLAWKREREVPTDIA